jgi:hypothetical protein
MATLTDEIVKQAAKLDEADQRQVLEYIQELVGLQRQSSVDMLEWLAQAETFQAELRAKHGENFVVNSQVLLDEAREERLNDIMDSR